MDGNMHCPKCGRLFYSSGAPELVADGELCECGERLSLILHAVPELDSVELEAHSGRPPRASP